MPRPRRPENKGLPARWTHRHGAYYFQVPPGLERFWDGKKLFRLGKTLPEAYKIWAERLGTTDKANTIGQLLDRYALEVVPTKAPKTQTGNIRYIENLRAVFGDLPLVALEPRHIYQYVDTRRRKAEHKDKDGHVTVSGGLVIARREIAVLSHVYTKAVEWGYIKTHPFKGQVRLEGEKPRTRYVEDWEIVECLSLVSPRAKGGINVLGPYIRLKLLTGMRRGDMLRLTASDLKDDGIHVKTSKTGKPIIYEWTDELRRVLDMVKAARPVDISPFLFCTAKGKGYINEKTGNASGWDSMWQRFMARVLDETEVTERFTEHDLRAKCASDAASVEHAQKLLAHADSRITDRVYRRKPERVKPLR